MHDTFLDKSHETVADLSEDIDSLFFWQIRVVVYKLLEIAVTYFLDDVVVMAAFHHIQNSHDILGFD